MEYIIIISYTDMPVGAPVPQLLDTKETVPYRPDKNLCLPLRSHYINPSYYQRKEALYQPPEGLATHYF